MSQDCNGNEYCGGSSDGGFIDLTQAGIGVANSGVWPYLHDRVQGQAPQPTTESSSINWAILAPAIVGAVLAIVLFVAVAIYVKRNKVTSRSSSSAEPQLEGVTVETAATSSPVVESATAEGQTASPETMARVPVVTLGETRA